MTTAAELRSGKTHRDENFPVASWIIHPRHRALILAFYNFVRTADDIADHADLPPEEKLRYLDLLEAELLGKGETQKEAVNLRHALAERSMSPRHALDVLIAFRMDVSKLRYENWDEVVHYCRYSAMPVGRFMLDVHGESNSTWVASDALCAGLQINNHLQDCAKDYHNLNRVYLPRDALAASGATVEMLGEARAPAPLRQCLQALAVRTEGLLGESKRLSAEVKDLRLGVEISVIQAFADKIVRMLKVRDPLSERVHLSPLELVGCSLAGIGREMARRAVGQHPRLQTGGRGMMQQETPKETPKETATETSHATTASGSSFYAAMRILPADQREAMFQIYSFCRKVDDIADSDGPRPERLAALQQWRDDIDALYRGDPPPHLRDYVASVKKFDLQREDFIAVIDGMEMDVPQDIRAPEMATLDLYCDRVASAVGRLSVNVFGMPREDGVLLAHHLGRALQLTNILRDIDEDAALGRLYLPRESLLHAGITGDDPARVVADRALPKVCFPLAERAKSHFAKAEEIMARNRRRSVRAPRIMGKYYRAILDLLLTRGFAPPRAPVHVSKITRLGIVFRYAFI